MKIMPTRQTPIDKLDDFLQTAENFNREGLLEDGYVVEIDEEIKGCFVLTTMEDDVYWLKQLYITKESANHLPVLLETILQMTKGKDARKLYVQSHQPVVDLLLQALQFYPQRNEQIHRSQGKEQGNWWAYEVSS